MGLEQISGSIRAVEYCDDRGFEPYRIFTIRTRTGDIRRIAVPYDPARDPVIPEIPLDVGTEINSLAYHPISSGTIQGEDVTSTALKIVQRASSRWMRLDGIAEYL